MHVTLCDRCREKIGIKEKHYTLACNAYMPSTLNGDNVKATNVILYNWDFCDSCFTRLIQEVEKPRRLE